MKTNTDTNTTQAQLLYILLHCKEYLKEFVDKNVSTDYFDDEYKPIIQAITDHYTKYNSLLTIEGFEEFKKSINSISKKISLDIAFSNCYASITDKENYSLLLDKIVEKNKQTQFNNCLLNVEKNLKSGMSYDDVKAILITELAKDDKLDTSPLYNFETLYYPLGKAPISIMPKVCRDYITTYTDVLSIPADYILLPMLSAIGSAAGKYYRFYAENSNYVRYPNIWIAIAGEPGLKKTTALNDIISPIRQADHELDAIYNRAVKAYKRDYDLWIKDPNSTKEPPIPIHKQHTFDQTTIQNFYKVLRDNPRGLLLKQDEISKFIKKMITDNDGSLETFLEIYTYGDINYSIKGNSASKQERAINYEFYDVKINNPFLSIIGGIQPTKLQKLLTLLDDDGFSSRFMIAYPNPIEDTNYDYNRKLNYEYMTAYNTLIKDLLSLTIDKDKEYMQTITLKSDQDVIDKYNMVCNKYGAHIKAYNLQGNIKYTMRKARDFFVRIALIVHIIKLHTGETKDYYIDTDTLSVAERLTDYVISHYYKFYDGFKTIFNQTTESEIEDQYQKIKKWIFNNKKCMPVFIMIRNRIFTTKTEAKHILNQLVKSGKGFFIDDNNFMTI